MHENLDEPIEVLVSFSSSTVRPHIFKWRGQRYQVKQVHLVHHQRDGEGKIYYFNVTDDANYFKLAFATRTLQWRITELYNEG